MSPGHPAISTVAPDHVRTLHESKVWAFDLGNLAIKTVETQLSTYETRRDAHIISNNEVPSLFDLSALSLVASIGDDAGEILNALEALPADIRGRAVWKINNIPYSIFCQIASGDDFERDIDDWILRNETWLRDTATTNHTSSGDDPVGTSVAKNWSYGFVRLSTHAASVFPGSKLTDTCRIVTRQTSLPGFKILDGLRSPVIQIQPSVDLYSKTFETMTQSLLKGINWANVFVAGGIALGTLLCTNDEQAINNPEQWEASDVDLYIYGLGPVEANEKIEHIFNVFKSNLPEDAPVLVVRNSKTITYFSNYPLRRIQVILKLVASPRDVLLNFDLDMCAVGWDGTEVWMLPRAARALETGYTVFTMDLINGHYLGDRRATQEQRVFKYADKGYGIRIPPSYLTELQRLRSDKERRDSIGIESGADGKAENLDIDKIAQKSRAWTRRAILKLARVFYPLSERRQPLPQISHSWIQENGQKTEDPANRSCLSGLMLFMRHVALWEHEVAGEIIILNHSWTAPMYDNVYNNINGVNYSDSPDYLWQIDIFNKVERHQMESNLIEAQQYWNPGWKLDHNTAQEVEKMFSDRVHPIPVQRMSHAASAHEILQAKYDIYLPVWLPVKFADFVEDHIASAVRESGIQGYTTPVFTQILKEWRGNFISDPELRPVIWRITNITMWQQLHRAIDEIHEVIWSCHRANSDITLNAYDRLKILLGHLGRRVIRKHSREEYTAFARWVAKLPVPVSGVGTDIYLMDNPDEGGTNDEG